MLITPEVLEQLGFKIMIRAKGVWSWWSVMSGGYEFRLRLDRSNNTWEFFPYRDDNTLSHSVSHIREIFGFIGEDFYQFGKEDAKKEVREVLGIK